MNRISIHSNTKSLTFAPDLIEVRGPDEYAERPAEEPFLTVALKDARHHAYLDLDHSSALRLLRELAGAFACATVSWAEISEGGSPQ